MKIMNHVFAVAAGVIGLSLVCDVLASETINGTIPAGTTHGTQVVVIQPYKRKVAPTDTIKFVFTAPPFDAGVPYALDFCIGPPSNPCGLPTSYVVSVPSGQSRLAVMPAAVFSEQELVVGQGTKKEVPYSVTIE